MEIQNPTKIEFTHIDLQDLPVDEQNKIAIPEALKEQMSHMFQKNILDENIEKEEFVPLEFNIADAEIEQEVYTYASSEELQDSSRKEQLPHASSPLCFSIDDAVRMYNEEFASIQTKEHTQGKLQNAYNVHQEQHAMLLQEAEELYDMAEPYVEDDIVENNSIEGVHDTLHDVPSSSDAVPVAPLPTLEQFVMTLQSMRNAANEKGFVYKQAVKSGDTLAASLFFSEYQLYLGEIEMYIRNQFRIQGIGTKDDILHALLSTPLESFRISTPEKKGFLETFGERSIAHDYYYSGYFRNEGTILLDKSILEDLQYGSNELVHLAADEFFSKNQSLPAVHFENLMEEAGYVRILYTHPQYASFAQQCGLESNSIEPLFVPKELIGN